MPLACLSVPDPPNYNRTAFEEGLKRCGFGIVNNPRPKTGDVLVTWNRGRGIEATARRYEEAGCHVIVTENGWIGADGERGRIYALCLSHHNGAGRWYSDGQDRWSRLGMEIQPWRESGEHILVLAQRGIGEDGIAMPKGWQGSVVKRLASMTRRPVRLRPHPGPNRSGLLRELEGAWAAVTWGSGAAVKAIVAGIPVFYELDGWIGAGAAVHGIANLEEPFLDDRLPMLNRLAWAQWTAAEIRTGEPFERLLSLPP